MVSPQGFAVGGSYSGSVAWSALRGSDMEEFDSEDFSTSEEDEDYVPSGKRFRLRREAACPAPRPT